MTPVLIYPYDDTALPLVVLAASVEAVRVLLAEYVRLDREAADGEEPGDCREWLEARGVRFAEPCLFRLEQM